MEFKENDRVMIVNSKSNGRCAGQYGTVRTLSTLIVVELDNPKLSYLNEGCKEHYGCFLAWDTELELI